MLSVTQLETLVEGLERAAASMLSRIRSASAEGFSLLYLRKNDKKFLTPVASDMIPLSSHVALDNTGHFDKTSIALGMTEPIIKVLEVIDVAHQHCDLPTVFPATAPELIKRFHHPAPVGNSG